MARLDQILTNREIEFEREEEGGLITAVIIDGERFPAINGEITQTVLSIAVRLDEQAKILKNARDEIHSTLLAALQQGIPVRDGARKPSIKVGKTTSVSYKGMVWELMEDMGKTKEEIESYVEENTTRGTKESVEIKLVK